MQIVTHSPRLLVPTRRRVEVVRAMPLGFGVGVGTRKRSAPIGVGFTPISFGARLVFWFDFGDRSTLFTDTAGSTLAGNGQGIGRVNDKSGNGRFLQQATGAQRPTLDTGFSPSVIFFSGTQRLFAASTFTVVPQPYSILIVSDNIANGSMFWDSGTTPNRQTAARGVNDTSLGFFAGASASVSGVPDLDAVRAWLVHYNGAASQLWCFDSATKAFVQQGANVSAGTNGLNDIRLGGNTANFLQSTATSEHLAFSGTLTAQDRASLAAYVQRWPTL